MYTNIPVSDLLNIIRDIITRNNVTTKGECTEILNLLEPIIDHNYIQHNDQYYKQTEGLAMGALTSAILAKVYIQYLEYTEIANILKKHQIADYHRYVDDILIIYNTQRMNIYDTLNEFNAINPKLKFTVEEQSDYTINFLDLTITNRNSTLDCSTLRKPTTTDTIVLNASCHPNEHKRAAITYLKNRVNTYMLLEKSKK
jgi:hypothetical protein